MMLTFKTAGLSDSGKTQKWLVVTSLGGIVLGEVRWYAAWRRYVFYPRPETVFDAGCLTELSSHCSHETEIHGRTNGL